DHAVGILRDKSLHGGSLRRRVLRRERRHVCVVLSSILDHLLTGGDVGLLGRNLLCQKHGQPENRINQCSVHKVAPSPAMSLHNWRQHTSQNSSRRSLAQTQASISSAKIKGSPPRGCPLIPPAAKLFLLLSRARLARRRFLHRSLGRRRQLTGGHGKHEGVGCVCWNCANNVGDWFRSRGVGHWLFCHYFSSRFVFFFFFFRNCLPFLFSF